jgi:hypothetical protein
MSQITDHTNLTDKERQLQELYNAIAFLENSAKNTSLEKKISSQDVDVYSVNSMNKVKYVSNVSNVSNEERIDGFRKQAEYGPKKFIKP